MTEIKHWLDESSDADDFERSILRAGAMSDPSDEKRDEVWSSVLGALAVAPALASAAGSSAAKAAGSGAGKAAVSSAGKAATVWLGVGKGLVVGLAIYGAASGVSEISERIGARSAPSASTPRAGATPPRAQIAPSVATPAASSVVPLTWVESSPTALPSAANLPNRPLNALNKAAAAHPAPAAELPSVAAFESTAPPPVTSATHVSQLKAEAAALNSARASLRAGQLTEASAQLEASRRQFSAPELYQEREALTIELLARSGQVSVAQQRASAFVKRFPESPHADQIRRFATPP